MLGLGTKNTSIVTGAWAGPRAGGVAGSWYSTRSAWPGAGLATAVAGALAAGALAAGALAAAELAATRPTSNAREAPARRTRRVRRLRAGSGSIDPDRVTAQGS